MFYGTTPACITAYLARMLRELKPKRVFEPCAGNFVISQVAGLVDPDIEVISGDVSSYSAAIGFGLVGEEAGIRLTPELEKEYPVFAGKTDPLDVAALVVIFSDLAQNRKKRHIAYYRQLEKDTVLNGEMYFEKVKTKLKAVQGSLGKFSFKGEDACIGLKECREGDLVWYDPPHFMGDYESMFKALDECFSFPEIKYLDLTDDRKKEHLIELRDKGCIVVTRPFEKMELPGYRLCYQFQYKRDMTYMLYTTDTKMENAQGRAVIMREKSPNFDVLFGQDDLPIPKKAKIQFVPLESKSANHYRLMWTKKAVMKDAGNPYGLFVNNKLLAVVSVMDGMTFSHHYAPIVADCAPVNTKYKRLSQLPLMCLMTEEFLDAFNNRTMWEHVGFTTQAYTDSPSSMKYRKLFKLEKRIEGSPSGHKFTLTYRAIGTKFKTLKAAYQTWYDRHAKEIKDGQ